MRRESSGCSSYTRSDGISRRLMRCRPSFRTALAEQSATPIEFFEASLESTLFAEDGSEAFLVDYLRASVRQSTGGLGCANRRPGADVLCSVTARQTVSRGFPMLVVGADKRRMSNLRSDANATAIGINFDFPGIIQNILQIFPQHALKS